VRVLAVMSPLLPHSQWMKMIAALSILSMIIGNAVAIAQRDLGARRLGQRLADRVAQRLGHLRSGESRDQLAHRLFAERAVRERRPADGSAQIETSPA